MSTTVYPHYPARTLLNLDGIHEFAFLGDGVPSLEKIDAAAIRYDDLMPVPGCFDASPRYAGKRGVAAYRITVELADESLLLLRLGALGLRGRILWDNTEIGIDELPYSQVEYEFESGPAGTHRLVLLIDNRLNFQDSPLFSVFYDFYGYGGIYRSLELFTLPQGSRFDRVRVTTVDPAARRVRLEGRMAGGSTPLRLGFDSAEPQPVEPIWHGDRFELELTVPGGQLWTPAAPQLHTVRLESSSDAIVERFGIRTVTAARGQILLNGEPLRLYGYNRHDAHPQFGPAMPVELQIADLQLMRELGCNFVRGCHYPQSQRFLDLCDQLGMLVWEESLGWGDRLEVQQDPKFRELQKIQTRRMVRNSCNHPSVILWGFMNEGGDNHETGESLMRELAAVIREEDRSRPLTMASMHIKESRCLDAYDVISFNTYPGWYDDPDGAPRPLNRIAEELDLILSKLATPDRIDKPVILSEIGAGAIYGWRDPLNSFWSEGYQADYLDEVCRYFASHPRLNGLVLWQFCDGRTYAAPRALGRPRAFNNKGTFDEYRRAKPAAEVVKRHFTSWN